MTALAVLIFAGLVLLAAAFAAWPLLRGKGRSRWLLVGALALLVAGVGLGAYLCLGRPALAVRGLEGKDTRDMNGMIAVAAHHLKDAPDDLRGWRVLGRAYLDAGDGADALKALGRAIQVARAKGDISAGLYSDYGLAVVSTSAGAVPPEAEQAFRFALMLDPKDAASLYFLGYASAARGEADAAIAFWQTLLDEAPRNAPFRQELVDRIARLKAQGGTMPDIGAMVAGLDARLRKQPDDPDGWMKLIRAYAVLNDGEKAEDALARARAAMAKDAAALAALDVEAKELKLKK
ncbi:MAG: tetratricopeptide repeat protein [Alphaproteobacteria bacterium]|nr:tetratricopeptide repeat protein [Alphaproteobacteria bacterium]